jgi:hypothetical protein
MVALSLNAAVTLSQKRKAWFAIVTVALQRVIKKYSYVFTLIAYVHLQLLSSASYKLAADLPKLNSTLNTGRSLHVGKRNSTIIKKQPVVKVSRSSQPGSPTHPSTAVYK